MAIQVRRNSDPEKNLTLAYEEVLGIVGEVLT